MVKVSKEEEHLAIILSYCQRNKNGLAEDGPSYVKRYAFLRFIEIHAREIEYRERSRSGHNHVPKHPHEVTCFHILSNMGKRSWESKSDQEKKEHVTAMRNARRKRRKTDDESDDEVRDNVSDDVSESKFTRKKKRRECSVPGCTKAPVGKGGMCWTHRQT